MVARHVPRVHILPLVHPSAGLGEFRIRDLNDEINKLMKTKYAWEKRIIELGGPNLIVMQLKIVASQSSHPIADRPWRSEAH